MKKPDEIKKGLEMCTHGADCSHCPYTLYECSQNQMEKDALALIRQLQAENAERAERIRQIEAERDAAVETIYEMERYITDACEWCDGVECERLCMMHLTERPGFKWRGVQKEE